MATLDDYSSDTSTTGVLQAGGQTSARFDQSGDTDWFRVTLAANSYYTFQLELAPQAGSSIYSSLSLRSPQGSYLSSQSSSSSGANTVATFKTGTAGDYFISAGTSYYSGTQSYAYTLKASAGTADAVGDTAQTAAPIVLGVQTGGVFEGPSDTDVYKIALEKGVSYQIKQTFTGISGNYSSIGVTNAAGQSMQGGSSMNGIFTFTAGASGDYYISTRGGGNEAQGYNLLAAAAADDYKAVAAGAGALQVGGSVKGKLEVGGDRDWYAVTLNANTVYWFTAKTDPASSGAGYSSSSTQLKLFDSAEQVMASISGYNSQAVLQFVPTKTGTYYFEVGDSYGYTGNYLASAGIGVRDDHGDTKAAATAIAVGSTASGKLELPTDSDMFKVAVKAGATYVFELVAKSTGNNIDMNLSGQDANGYSSNLVTYSKTGVAEYRVYTAATTGDFYLTVSNGYSGGTPGYTLQVSTPAADDFAASAATAGALATGEKVAGTLDYVGDVDWIKVKLAAGNKYAFVLEGAASGQGTLDVSNVGMSLLNSQGGGYYNLQGFSGLKGRGYSFTCETGGDYYLAVTPGSYYGAVTGTYAVSAYNLSGDKALPGLVSFAPGSGSTGASLTGNITLTFNELVRGGEGYIRLVNAVGDVVESFYLSSSENRIQVNGNVVTINPTANLQPGTKYTLEVPAGSLLDYAGNKFLASSVYSFTTVETVAQGGSGNDLLSGIGTNVRLSGGDGIDTVIYGSTWSNYDVGISAGEASVRYRYGGSSGTGDSLTGVERLQFSDRSIALDVNGHGGQAYRLYQAAFNRAPDKEGLGFWMAQMDNGSSLNAVANAFLGSTEFQQRYGNLSNEEFVNSMFENVLHRAGKPAGIAFWVGQLDNGATRADVLMGFSESAENSAEILQIIGNGFEYTPYG
ncbi:hypothetical protein ASD15_18235 [Massilia sp. Root351]|uniref:DUF4214 domain-containing protein n=1 Tax=Massilia sp. Root351 TaxID=1736522 RepID=UPI00070B37E9|nr:DUF4214 domain-containing protein [Massilia sp. Root351]KQV79284.1 hypothetical protein ASD15_18235 [Massilia sp. Root351]